MKEKPEGGVDVGGSKFSKEGADISMVKSSWRSVKFRQKLLFLVAGWVLVFMFLESRVAVVDAQALTPDEIEKVKEFLKEHNPTFNNFTYDQLKQWFEAQTPEDYKWQVYPRLYPFCITTAQIDDPSRTQATSKIFQFREIFADIERINQPFYNFNVTRDSMTGAGGKEWISEIKINRINTPEMDMVNLRQWLHVEVISPRELIALYVQSIVGPMGLPFGEFSMEFPCADIPDSKDIDQVGDLEYCSYRPRTTIQHPSVYVGTSPTGRKSWHMHYHWTDITCMETPYIQFLMIAVESFDFNATTKGNPKMGKNYQPVYSHIYLNTDFDSKSGAPFPYYAEWKNKMYCNLNGGSLDAKYKQLYGSAPNKYPSTKSGADPRFAKIAWRVLDKTYRIQANEEYDACLTHRMKDMSQQDKKRLECPPGPFRCDTTYGGQSPAQLLAQREKLVVNEQNVSNCFPCGPPSCEDAGFPDHKCDYKADDRIQNRNNTDELENVEAIARAKTHSFQAVIAFLVLVPLSNFVARFFKEMCVGCLCSNGPWIFIHIGLQVTSLMFMWISLGPVFPKLAELRRGQKRCKILYPNASQKADRRECLDGLKIANPHVILGGLAFIFQHFLVLSGFIRSANSKLRFIETVIHSHLGYACWLFGGLSVIVVGAKNLKEKECPDDLYLGIMFMLCPLMFTVIGVALDCATDKKVGIIPPRKQWPILETVKLEGRSPFALPKWIIFGLFIGAMFFLWIMYLASGYTVLAGSGDLLSAKAKRRLKKIKKLSISGLFGGDCGGAKQVEEADMENQETIQ